MRKLLTVCLIFISLAGVSQNVGIGTKTPQQRLHVIDSVGNVKVVFQAVGPSLSTTKDVTLEMIQEAGTDDWLQLKKYYYTSTDFVDGIAMANSGALLTGYETDFLRLGALSPTGNVDVFAGGHRRMVIANNGNVGIGTGSSPAARLHILSSSFEAARFQGPTAAITLYDNSNYRGYIQAWTDALGIGATTGNALRFYTQSGAERMTILDNGNTGINQPSPSASLEVTSNASGTALVTNGNVRFTGIGEGGIRKYLVGNSTGAAAWSNLNGADVLSSIMGANIGTSLAAPVDLLTIVNFGTANAIVGANADVTGAGLVGIQSSAGGPGSYTGVSAGVAGDGYTGYGVYARSLTGTSLRAEKGNLPGAAGSVAEFINNKPGITSPAVLIQSQNGQPALELNNGTLKVSGTNKAAFQHVATAGNTSGNETVISNTSLANSATDLLFITAYWDGTYVNAPVGVYFSAGSWRIFRQDLGAMPVGAKFNVLVVKQ